MEVTGILAPDSVAAARDTYADLGPAVETIVTEIARTMDRSAAAHDERVTDDVIETARDATFASLLRVTVGTREEFETWRDGFDGDVTVSGSDHVDGVVWHAVDGEAVAATFADDREAAVGTLRRQAFGRLYRDRLES
ncbi:hypothetical protein BRD17_04485 [Halobacteriales archaeon SW_7_68_16]|nr:MAG: hypothetical protein BRD17_04485 [Halobacteriales archaeon SW_7_68_16]